MVEGVIGSTVRSSQVVVALHHQHFQIWIFSERVAQPRGRVWEALVRAAPLPLFKTWLFISENLVGRVDLVGQFGTHVVVEDGSVGRQDRRPGRIVERSI